MHMADALVTPAVALTMYAASSATAALSVNKVRLENNHKIIPLMGVMSAFVFSAQMVNFSIPGTGSSGHLEGSLLLSILLGPYAGFLSMISVLLIQCLLFSDGGILAFGCNLWNMAFYGCFIGYLCIYQPLIRKSKKSGTIFIGCILASIVSLQLGALSVVLETKASGISSLSFYKFLLLMQPIHLAIGIIEGLITAAVVIFVKNARPELLQRDSGENKVSLRHMLILLSIVVVLIGGGMSLIASDHPDGLEWSIQKITGSTDVQVGDNNRKAVKAAEEVQKKTALLSDYSINGRESTFGTSFSGIVGSVLVVILCVGCGILLHLFRNKGKAEHSRKRVK